MSYDICRAITKKGDKLQVSIASSNVFPKHWEKCEVKGKNIDEKLFWLFTDIMSGGIHLNNSVYNYSYAYYKALEYLKEDSIDSYDDLYTKKYNYYNEKMRELVGIDLTSDYWKNEELYNKYKKFEEENKDLIDEIRFESYYKVYGKVFEIFKKALEEKEDNTLYTLFSEDYNSFIKCGRNGTFYYGYSSAIEKGKYKEMYCKMKNIDRANVVVKRLLLTDKEIQKEFENQELERQAKEKIKDLEQVKRDMESFKNGGLDIDKYYLKELCKLYNIKEKNSGKNVVIPTKLKYIMKNGYSYNGKHSYKTSNKIWYIKDELLKVIG